jgi:hypothetical protein
MELYIFTLSDGHQDFYREEVLAVSDEEAIELTQAALASVRLPHKWKIASLSDLTGKIIWREFRTYPRTPGH